MENHLHLVAASPDLSATMRPLSIQISKSWTARRIIDYPEETHARRMLELLAVSIGKTQNLEESGLALDLPPFGLGAKR